MFCHQTVGPINWVVLIRMGGGGRERGGGLITGILDATILLERYLSK